jgi:integrase
MLPSFGMSKRREWPKIKPAINHGKPVYVVDARIAGKGERRFFPTRQEAEGWALAQRVQRKNQGDSAFDNSELAVFGLSVADAVKFTLDYYRRRAASAPVDEVVRQLLESKRAAGRSPAYLSVVRLNLAKVVDHFDGRMISTITAPELERFLAGLPVAPGTWNKIRQDCVTLFGFALKAGYAVENVARATERAKLIDEPPGILTPEQAAALLVESKDDDLLAFHAIGLFAGLRVAEIARLDWRDVDLPGGFIHVGAKISKTRSRRLVPILDNLKAWLQPIAKPAGPVLEGCRRVRSRHEAARERAGITDWPKNAARHSYVSYRLAATQNAPQVALESGHDQAVLFAHYREIVRPAAAERFFSIAPLAEVAGKVVAIA